MGNDISAQLTLSAFISVMISFLFNLAYHTLEFTNCDLFLIRFLRIMNITVQMYPRSEGTDAGSPAL